MARITVMGDNCVDQYLAPNEARYPGGNAVNMSMHLKKLGNTTRYAGCIGDDADGAWLLRVLQRLGIDTNWVTTKEGKTGVTKISLKDGERTFEEEIVGVQSPLIFSQQILDEIAYESTFIVHTAFAGYQEGPKTHQPELERELWYFEQAGVPVAMDFSINSDPDLMQEFGPFLELAFVSAPDVSDEEAESLATSLKSLGPRCLILTRGAKGSLATDGKQIIRQPAEAITPVDTLGAGDSFLAGYVNARAKFQSTEECLRSATALATEVCGYFGSCKLTDEELA